MKPQVLRSDAPPPSPLRTNARPKLRRRVTISDCLNESTAVQRLVEYFVIVSCQPRVSNQDGKNINSMQTPPPPRQKQMQQRVRSQNDEEVPETRQPDLTTSSCLLSSDSATNGNIHMPKQQTYSELTFQPVITARYPEKDHADSPLNPMIVQFCYPIDDVIVPTSRYEMPKVHHFVLTQGCGRKLYATCLTVLEEYEDTSKQVGESVSTFSDGDEIELSVSSEKKATQLYIPKVLCLLSTWPYLTAFREYLSQLYRLASTTNVMTAPIERYIVNICQEIPAPPPGVYEIQLPILDSMIRFWAPPAKLPIAYVALPFQRLFECLDVEHILTVWMALMMERKVLLLSSQCSILTVCAEILLSLLFPFRWSHLYAPLLPRMLTPMLDAPVPYLCGVMRENWLHGQQFVSAETIVVDLDHNSIRFGPLVTSLPTAPHRKLGKLQASLTEIVGEVFWRARDLHGEYHEMMQNKPSKRSYDQLRQMCTAPQSRSKWGEKLETFDHAFNLAYTPESPNLLEEKQLSEPSRWDQVQEAFLRFFVAVLKDYRKYLNIPVAVSESSRPTFDRIGFIAGERLENLNFITELCTTQQFDDFLTRRMYSPGEPDLVFFDQSIDAKLNRSKLKIRKVETPFLHSAKVHKELTKLDAVPPNEDNLMNDTSERRMPYMYKSIPQCLDTRLFSIPRPIPKTISAEFDRQAILVSRLRARIIEEEEEDLEDEADDQVEFFSGDYDPSPEVASFTVFLYVYSSLVGQEWQEYARKRRGDALEKNMSERDMESGPEEREAASFEEAEIASGCRDDDSYIQHLSMCCFESCPRNSLLDFRSILFFLSNSADDAYQAFFQQSQNNPCFALEDRHIDPPKSNVALAEYEEAKEVTYAQLDLAFETLATMSLRGLSVDSDAYLSLMEACGRCNDMKRAVKLIEIMKKDGFVADRELLSCFMAAFADDAEQDEGPASQIYFSGEDFSRHGSKSNAESVLVKRNSYDKYCGGSSIVDRNFLHADEGSVCSDWTSKSSTGSSAFYDWITQHPLERIKKKERKRKRKRLRAAISSSEIPVTDTVARQLVLGESLLDFVYPDLVLDTNNDSCPHCSYTMTEDDIVSGWRPCSFQNFKTKCPKCHFQFVPQFSVTSTLPDFEGSQGPQTPLYCEFLSPWVLRREFQHIIKDGSGIDDVLNPEWRSGTDIRAALFWNLIVICRRYRLPFTFLLQGNFHNRIILPRKPDEI